jgi:hypothetical protein
MVQMMCMTTKQTFETSFEEGLEAVVLRNGRFAYRSSCPWVGKGGRSLTAFKFCSREAYESYRKYSDEQEDKEESET